MSDEDFDGLTTRDIIIGIRGGVDENCSFCGQKTDPDKLHPEEAGDWVCEECLKRWGEL